jgi:hypothetical protein
MAKINLTKQADLYKISNALERAYANQFSEDTLNRAIAFTEGATNKSRNYMWAIIASTKGTKGTLMDVYTKKTAESIIKLTISGLARNNSAQSASVDAF